MPNTFGDALLNMVKTHPFTSVPITFGVQTGYGFDFVRGASARGFVGDYEAVLAETSVLVKYGDFTSLQQGSAITVDSTTYQIVRVELIDDAHVIKVYLTDAA